LAEVATARGARTHTADALGMSAEPPSPETLFARLLCDVMIPAEFSAAIRAHGYDVAEVRTVPVEIQQDDEAILRAAAQHTADELRDQLWWLPQE